MELVLETLELVRKEIQSRLMSAPLIIRAYTKHLLKTEGKYIRALSVLSAALDSEGQIDKNAVLVASAIEILHLATLVHDDVMDEADERRGVITLHQKYGRKTAVITGDFLLAMALRIVSEVENKEKYIDLEFDDTMMDIALGELNQHINNGNYKLTEKEYYEIIEGKTAALFEASFYAGAVLRSLPSDDLKIYRMIGHDLGMIFQLMDDALDYQTSRKKALKPVVSDFDQGVVTLPLIYAMQQDASLYQGIVDGEIQSDKVQKKVLALGGIEYTYRTVVKYELSVKENLTKLKLNPDQYHVMESILKRAMAHGVI